MPAFLNSAKGKCKQVFAVLDKKNVYKLGAPVLNLGRFCGRLSASVKLFGKRIKIISKRIKIISKRIKIISNRIKIISKRIKLLAETLKKLAELNVVLVKGIINYQYVSKLA